MSQPMTAHETGTIVHVAPESLVMERNIRQAKPDADLTRSIQEVGVLEPITAALNADGALVVRYGHRRTLAAIEAGRTSVPVYVFGEDSTDTGAEVHRIIAQRDENTHRSGLTTAEEVGVVEQLTLLGLTAAQVAKRARIKRPDVDAALSVAGSKIARKAAERYDALTLDQAATVAEFEDDADTVKALIVAAAEGKFDHVAQRARDKRAEEVATAEAVGALEAQGVTVVDRPSYDDKHTARLERLSKTAEDRASLDAEEHRTCPGHVAWLQSAWVRIDATGSAVEEPEEPEDDAAEDAWDTYEEQCRTYTATTRQVQRPAPVYGCAGWNTHGHNDTYSSYGSGSGSRPKAADMSEEERETAKTARRLVIDNNKAWTSAETVRREFLTGLAKAKTPPKGAARFLAVAMCKDGSLVASAEGNTLAAQWLGSKKEGYGRADLSPAKSATEQRALVVALVQVLADYEAQMTKDSWRGDGTKNAPGRYLRFLATCGYTLADVEQYAASSKTA